MKRSRPPYRIDRPSGCAASAGGGAVEASGLAKRYRAIVAVERPSFTVETGEILSLLGPNGAGKRTATRLLTTIRTRGGRR